VWLSLLQANASVVQRYLLQPARVEEALEQGQLKVGSKEGLKALVDALFALGEVRDRLLSAFQSIWVLLQISSGECLGQLPPRHLQLDMVLLLGNEPSVSMHSLLMGALLARHKQPCIELDLDDGLEFLLLLLLLLLALRFCAAALTAPAARAPAQGLSAGT
jgi:hypothetical protein